MNLKPTKSHFFNEPRSLYRRGASRDCSPPPDRALDPDLVEALVSSGHRNICVRQRHVCALKRFSFTTAVVVGLDLFGYKRRYCYEKFEDAETALFAWDGQDHPGGPWIKCKGAGLDMLNPEFS